MELNTLFVLLFTLIATLWMPSFEATSLATFQTSLFPYRNGISLEAQLGERVERTAELLNSSDFDIVCLQGVHMATLQRQFYAALRSNFKHIFSAQDLNPSTDNETRACTPDHLADFYNCSSRGCAGRNLTGLASAFCKIKECATRINSYGQPCRDCFILYEVRDVSACGTHLASDFATNYGLMLFSKKPMYNTNAVPFNALSQFRGYLEAYVPGVGNILCTQLTTPFSDQFYVGPPVVDPLLYHSFEQQQLDEIGTTLAWTENKKTPILMGDFSHGPVTIANTSWRLPLHYGLVSAHGFTSPYVIQDGRYTNLMTVVDHIYIPSYMYKEVDSATRIFYNEVTINQIPISNHFGVKIVFKNSERPAGPGKRSIVRGNVSFYQLFKKFISEILLGYGI